MAANYPNVV